MHSLAFLGLWHGSFFSPPWQSTTTTHCMAGKTTTSLRGWMNKSSRHRTLMAATERRREGKDFDGALWWFRPLLEAFFALALIILRFLLHSSALPVLWDETQFPHCLKCQSPPPPAAAPWDLSVLSVSFSAVYTTASECCAETFCFGSVSFIKSTKGQISDLLLHFCFFKKAQGWFCQDVCCQINSSLASVALGSEQNLVAKTNKHSHKNNTNIKLGHYASQMWSI